MFINPQDAQNLEYGQLVSLVYEKVRSEENGPIDARVQYVTTEGQTCVWSIELIDQQDVFDLCLFIKGICSVSDEEARIEGISFLDYESRIERGKKWRENVASQAQRERS